MSDTNISDGRQSLSDLGNLAASAPAAEATSADAYLAGAPVAEPAPLRQQELDAYRTQVATR